MKIYINRKTYITSTTDQNGFHRFYIQRDGIPGRLRVFRSWCIQGDAATASDLVRQILNGGPVSLAALV